MTAPTGRPRGRPPGVGKSPYNPEIALEVCLKIMEGQTLTEICADEAMPTDRTIYRWLAVTPAFHVAYMRAREMQMHKWADDIIQIADDARNDYMDRVQADGSTDRVLDNEHVRRSQMRIDTRKFLMAKIAPKVFGDRIEVEHKVAPMSELSDAELEAKTRLALDRLGATVPVGPLLIARARAAGKEEPATGEGDGLGGGDG